MPRVNDFDQYEQDQSDEFDRLQQELADFRFSVVDEPGESVIPRIIRGHQQSEMEEDSDE